MVCLEMSSNLKYYFGIVVEEIFELGHTHYEILMLIDTCKILYSALFFWSVIFSVTLRAIKVVLSVKNTYKKESS